MTPSKVQQVICLIEHFQLFFINTFRSSAVLDKNKQLRAAHRKSRPGRPPNHEAVVEWFHQEEKSRKTVVDPHTERPSIWFHGKYSIMLLHFHVPFLYTYFTYKIQDALNSHIVILNLFVFLGNDYTSTICSRNYVSNLS